DSVTGFGVQPTARIGWDIVPGRQQIWGAVSRALRTPSSIDLGAVVNVFAVPSPAGIPVVVTAQGNPAFGAEEPVDGQIGYRATLSASLDMDVTAFRSDYDRLRSYEPQPLVFVPTPSPHLVSAVQFQNLFNADTYGLEAAAHWTP